MKEVQRTESKSSVPLISISFDSIVTVYFCIFGSPSHLKPVDSQLPLDPSSMVVIAAKLAVVYPVYTVPLGKVAQTYATVTESLGNMNGNASEVEVKKMMVREFNRSVETASKYHHWVTVLLMKSSLGLSTPVNRPGSLPVEDKN